MKTQACLPLRLFEQQRLAFLGKLGCPTLFQEVSLNGGIDKAHTAGRSRRETQTSATAHRLVC